MTKTNEVFLQNAPSLMFDKVLNTNMKALKKHFWLNLSSVEIHLEGLETN